MSDKDDTAEGMQYTDRRRRPWSSRRRGSTRCGSSPMTGVRSPDGQVVIDHDGLHAMKPKRPVELVAGSPLLVRHFSLTADGASVSSGSRPERLGSRCAVERARVPAGEVRVTSPGRRRSSPARQGLAGRRTAARGSPPEPDLATVRQWPRAKVGGIAWLLTGGCPRPGTWKTCGSSTAFARTIVRRSPRSASRRASQAAWALRRRGRRLRPSRSRADGARRQDEDGVADEYRCLASGWNVTANHGAARPVEKDGWLYLNLAVAIEPGGKSSSRRSPRCVRASASRTGKSRRSRTDAHADGIGPAPEADLPTDNQGDWLPSSKLLHFEPGASTARARVPTRRRISRHAAGALVPARRDREQPEQLVLIPAGWGPYSGQMCHGDVTAGGVERDFVEQVDGVWQGCVFWLDARSRGRREPHLLRARRRSTSAGSARRGTGDRREEAFRPPAPEVHQKPTFEILAMRSRSDGFEIEFTEPLAKDVGWEIENWRRELALRRPRIRRAESRSEGARRRGCEYPPDRRRAFLRVDGFEPDHVVTCTSSGRSVESGHPCGRRRPGTLNRIRRASWSRCSRCRPRGRRTSSPRPAKEGWRLFDGRTTAGGSSAVRARPLVPSGWRGVEEGYAGARRRGGRSGHGGRVPGT